MLNNVNLLIEISYNGLQLGVRFSFFKKTDAKVLLAVVHNCLSSSFFSPSNVVSVNFKLTVCLSDIVIFLIEK